MKNLFCFAILVGCVASLAACHSTRNDTNKDNTYQRKIYLTEQDYLDDLATTAQVERREAKPSIESNYLIEIQPETNKNVYFFDDRVRPLVPDTATDRDYKKTKRLWEKPKRYSPEEYYANQPEETSQSSSSSSSSYSSSSYYDDYDY